MDIAKEKKTLHAKSSKKSKSSKKPTARKSWPKPKGGSAMSLASERPERMRQYVMTMGDAYDSKTSFVHAPSLADVQFAVLVQEMRIYETEHIDQWMLAPTHRAPGIYNSGPSGGATEEMRQEFLAVGGDAEEYFKNASPEAIDSFFRFCFTGGEGIQWGNPGKEWYSCNIRPIESLSWRKVGSRSEWSASTDPNSEAIERTKKFYKKMPRHLLKGKEKASTGEWMKKMKKMPALPVQKLKKKDT
eukprot:CAMPEP_0114496746 /NCGR_PEP_ID=MMETSP0109-20121206/5936_1 /TAXON_ID=29199 /ORGANISM="Chlorarachnion reptans, Strain CCCM449" /LENGTH=244 /DNA_ID=CAMNT_0001674043 /DNA_START=61 /DNA_END=795 /DNA_ORIENTATION=+